jgi:hypothetical protein
LAGVDEWQAERVAQIGREADRRREEHCGDAAAGWRLSADVAPSPVLS